MLQIAAAARPPHGRRQLCRRLSARGRLSATATRS